jgi:hypothetical protein
VGGEERLFDRFIFQHVKLNDIQSALHVPAALSDEFKQTALRTSPAFTVPSERAILIFVSLNISEHFELHEVKCYRT